MSADPVFAPDDHESLNGYAYANNTPVTKSDPTGLRPITACEQGCSDGHGGTYRDHLSPNGNGGWTYHSTATYVTRVNIKGVGNGTIFTTVTTVGGYRGVKVVFKKGPDPKQEDKGQCNGCWAMGTNPHYDRNANDIPDSGKLATWQKVILGVAFAVAAAVAVAPVAVEGALACLAAVIVCAEGAAEVISGGAGVSATSVWAAGGAKGAGYRNLMEADDVFGLNAAKALPKEGFYDVAIHGSKTDFGKSIDSWSKGTNFSHRTLAKLIKQDPNWDGAPIRLLSCDTGACDASAAQNLSNKLGVPVLAPTEKVWAKSNGVLRVGPKFYGRTGEWVLFQPGANSGGSE